MTTLMERPVQSERCADCGGALFIHGDCVSCTPLSRTPVASDPGRGVATMVRPFAVAAPARVLGSMRYDDWADVAG